MSLSVVAPLEDEAGGNSASDAALPMLCDMASGLAAELERLLEKRGESLLAKQVRELCIADACLHWHGSDFYIAPRSAKPFGEGHRTTSLIAGHLVVDVVMDRIVLGSRDIV